MGELLGAIGQAISRAIEDVLHAIEGAVHGAFGSVASAVGLPLLLLAGFVALAGLAWVLAKR